MIPILRVIANSIKRFFTRTVAVGDPYWDNVVLNMRMEASDPYWDKKVLGLHCDGTNGSTTFTDVKGKTVTVLGNTQISTAQYPTLTGKTSSAYFDGTGDYLSVPDSTDWAFGSGDFTLRAKIRLTAYATLNAGNYVACVISQHVSTQHSFLFYILGTSTSYTTLSFDGYDSAPSNTTINATYNFSLNTWYDIECCRSGNLIYMFVDGILINSGGSSFSKTLIDSTTTLKIGSLEYDATYKYAFPGYISEVEIYKGVALHTTNFNLSADPFPEPAPVDDTGKSITVVGNSILQGTTKKYGTGALYFDGTGDYLSVAHSGDLSLSNLDFTIEGWVYFNSVSGIQAILDPRGTTHDYACAYEIGLSGAGHTGKIQFAADTAAYNTNGSTWDVDLYSTTSAAINTWYHVAVTRSGSSWKLFINGVQEASTTSSITIGAAAPTVYVGSGVSGAGTIGNNLNGYVDDIRITKGIARYTANFTPTYIESGPLAGDPYYNYTSMLLKMNGADTSTTFTDNSYSPKTYTANGNAQLKTANYRYGTASGYFDGTGDYVITTDTSVMNFLAADFTIECWIYPTLLSGINQTVIATSNSAGSDPTIAAGMQIYTDNKLYLVAYIGSTSYNPGYTNVGSGATLVLNTWGHHAIVRSGTNLLQFFNGTLVATIAVGSGSCPTIANSTAIGRLGEYAGQYFNGYIDDVRVTKGIARYTTNFTPPGSHIATQHPDTDPWWLNTVLALRMDGTSGSTTFTDLKGKTVTAVGNASVSLAQSKFGQAAYFDGAGDYLSIPDSNDFNLGADNFTIESWVYLSGYAADNISSYKSCIVSQDLYGDRSFHIVVMGTASSFTTLEFWGYYDNTNYVTVSGSFAFSLNTWYHVAIVRDGNLVYLYVNGTLLNSGGTTFTQTIRNSGTALKVGAIEWDATYHYYLNGYLDDIRITKGIARYTANFTPSEKPLPTYVVGPSHDSYWQNVVLALPFNTGLSDARGKTVTAYGNAAISNAEKKFGSNSCYFDGTGDYLSVTHSGDLSLSNLDFTIEGWVYFNSVSGIQFILDSRGTTNDNVCAYHITNGGSGHSGKITFAADTAAYNTDGSPWDVDLYSTTSPVINTWYHIAITRSGSTWKLFINGVQEATTTSSITVGTAAPTVYIGSGVNGAGTIGYNLNGYVDDLRITKGIARYTAGFTPPTSANILG